MKRLPATAVYYALHFGLHLPTWVVMAVYLVRDLHFSPLQLVLMGTAMEAAVFLFEVPTGIVAATQIHPLSPPSGSVMTTTSSMRSSKPASRTSRRFVSAGKLEKNICTPSHSSVRSGLPTWLSDARKSPPGFSQRRMRANSSAWALRGTWMIE